MVDISEKNFEETVETVLLAGNSDSLPPDKIREIASFPGEFIIEGYNARLSSDYDKKFFLLPKNSSRLRSRHTAQGMGKTQK